MASKAGTALPSSAKKCHRPDWNSDTVHTLCEKNGLFDSNMEKIFKPGRTSSESNGNLIQTTVGPINIVDKLLIPSTSYHPTSNYMAAAKTPEQVLSSKVIPSDSTKKLVSNRNSTRFKTGNSNKLRSVYASNFSENNTPQKSYNPSSRLQKAAASANLNRKVANARDAQTEARLKREFGVPSASAGGGNNIVQNKKMAAQQYLAKNSNVKGALSNTNIINNCNNNKIISADKENRPPQVASKFGADDVSMRNPTYTSVEGQPHTPDDAIAALRAKQKNLESSRKLLQQNRKLIKRSADVFAGAIADDITGRVATDASRELRFNAAREELKDALGLDVLNNGTGTKSSKIPKPVAHSSSSSKFNLIKKTFSPSPFTRKVYSSCKSSPSPVPNSSKSTSKTSSSPMDIENNYSSDKELVKIKPTSLFDRRDREQLLRVNTATKAMTKAEKRLAQKKADELELQQIVDLEHKLMKKYAEELGVSEEDGQATALGKSPEEVAIDDDGGVSKVLERMIGTEEQTTTSPILHSSSDDIDKKSDDDDDDVNRNNLEEARNFKLSNRKIDLEAWEKRLLFVPPTIDESTFAAVERYRAQFLAHLKRGREMPLLNTNDTTWNLWPQIANEIVRIAVALLVK